TLTMSAPSCSLNATRRPSGENTGFEPPSVPLSGVGSSETPRRIQIRVPRAPAAAYASSEPSGDSAILPMGIAVSGSARVTRHGGEDSMDCVRWGGINHPHAAAADAIIAIA